MADKKLVNLLVGRFQPFTVSDFEDAKKMNLSNGLPVVLMYVRSHQGYKNTPLKSETVKNMLTELTESDLFDGVLCSDSWSMQDILSKIGKSGYKVESVRFSDHDKVKGQLARLSVAIGDRRSFCSCVPRKLRKYFDNIREDMDKY